MILPLFGDSRPLDMFSEHLKCRWGALPSHPAPMLSYHVANTGRRGSTSFTFPLFLPSPAQLLSHSLNLTNLSTCSPVRILSKLEQIGLEQGPGGSSITGVKAVRYRDNEASIFGFSKGFCPYFNLSLI